MWIKAWSSMNSTYQAEAGCRAKLGTIRSSGLGKAIPFDLVNAAERIYLALTPNVHRYGTRSSVALGR